jgi:hypothetical protein
MSEKARLAQSVERLALNQVVVGSSPTVGDSFIKFYLLIPFAGYKNIILIILFNKMSQTFLTLNLRDSL